MHDLIVKRLCGGTTDIENRQLDRWRAESAENDREYREFVRLWSRIDEVSAQSAGPAPALEQIIRLGDARKARREARAARRAALRSPWIGYGLAAAAATALVFLAVRPDGTQPPPAELSLVESSSGPGDVTTMSLSDGSILRVAPGTRVEFSAASASREVVVEGKAFFAVVSDSVPFVVRTRLGDVTVHGTRFEVFTDGDQLRLTVVEGTVRLHGTAGSADVGPSQIGLMRPGESPRVVDHEDVWSVLDWAGGLLIFQATPLSQVAAEIGRHFGREVRVDPELEGLRVTAWFEDESLDEVVSTICLVAGARCVVDEAVVTMER